MSPNLRGKQPNKHAKDNSSNGEAPKENYIHVRARRGQATNSHSLAERVSSCYYALNVMKDLCFLMYLEPRCFRFAGQKRKDQ